MKRTRILLVAVAVFSANSWAAQPYMDDSNKSPPVAEGGLPSLQGQLYPRIYQHEMMGTATAAAMSKYDFIDTHGISFAEAEAAEVYSPSTMVLRHISGRAYQSYTQPDPCAISGGVAFAGTGPVSQGGPQAAGCNIYAGHWLYKAGSHLMAAVDASALTLRVYDASKFAVGQYVVIYDAPAGSFAHAEHALVLARDLAANTLTLKARGFKSTAAPHAAGAIVAQHVLGQGEDNQLWAFNFSSQSPKDANGKTWGDFYATWVVNNYKRVKSGQLTTANVVGVLFDADFYTELVKNATDTNNDLTTDNAVGPGGENWLGEGLDQLYGWVTTRAPYIYLMTGTHDARGYASAQGNEMETWLDYGNGDFNPTPKYLQLNSMFAMYLYSTGARSRGAPLVHNLSKTPTKLYPGSGAVPADNRAFRLGLTMTLLENGYFGTHSRCTPDAWWDEYAVDAVPTSPTFGRAIPQTDIDGIHQHRGWLGKPLGKFTRIYTDANFAATQSLLPNGTFDANLDNWTASNVNVTRTTATTMDGAGSLWVSTMNTYQGKPYGARVRSATMQLVAGKGYTLAFSARADKPREVVVAVGTETGVRIPVGPTWRRYVIGFQQKASQTSRVSFQVGRENTQVWLDSVYVFEGNANVFRRDFEHGIAIANATPETRTVELGNLFRRISGTQDPAINSGQSVTAVTLAPYDGVVLVRPPGS